jgi:hypothetical protein
MFKEIIIPSLFLTFVFIGCLFLKIQVPMNQEIKDISDEIALNYLNIHNDCTSARHWNKTIDCDSK